MSKSPLRYPGGKSKAVPVILPYILEKVSKTDNKVCSPFFGGGSIELALTEKGISVIGSDILTPLIYFWQEIIKDPVGLAKEIEKLYPVSKNEFYILQDTINHSELFDRREMAAIFYVLNRCSFSGTTMSGGMSYGHPRFTKSSIDRVKDFRVKNLEIYEADFKEALYKNSPVLAYLDPPYLNNEKLYGVKGDLHYNFNHIELSEVLKKRSNWILSYNDCPEIRELYKGYEIVELNWKYGMSKDKKSREILVLG